MIVNLGGVVMRPFFRLLVSKLVKDISYRPY